MMLLIVPFIISMPDMNYEKSPLVLLIKSLSSETAGSIIHYLAKNPHLFSSIIFLPPLVGSSYLEYSKYLC